MRCTPQILSRLLALALGSALFGGCGPSHGSKVENTTTAAATTKPAATPAASPTDAKPDARSLTLKSDDEFIANGREVVRRLVEIFTNDGQDCDRLAADISKLSEDPIWLASTHYEDEHPEVRERFAAEQREMGERFSPVAKPAVTACAKNKAFTDALAKMR